MAFAGAALLLLLVLAEARRVRRARARRYVQHLAAEIRGYHDRIEAMERELAELGVA